MVVVGLCLLAVVVGLTLLRRWGVGRWVAGNGARVALWPWCFAMTFTRALIVVAAPALVLTAGAIALGTDLEAAQHGAFDQVARIRAWPVVLTAVVAAWFTIGSTVRAIRAGRARWLRGRWLGLDGRWYEQVVPAGNWDPSSGLWLGADGNWYPPPADDAGPIGPATGWWQAHDGRWYPPQNWTAPHLR